jgi:hypothetical protein
MIPSLAMVRVGSHHRRGVRVWLPLFLLWPLLVPFALLLAIAAPILARAYRISGANILRTAWQLVSGCRGMRIEVDSRDIALAIRFI